MEVWNITAGKLTIIFNLPFELIMELAEMLIFETAYNASNIPRNMKVRKIQIK